MARRTSKRGARRSTGYRGRARVSYGGRRSIRRAPQRRVTSRSSRGGSRAGTVRIVIQQAAPAVAPQQAVSFSALKKARF